MARYWRYAAPISAATLCLLGFNAVPAAGQVSTTRVSVASDGTQGNAGSSTPSISADGRFVAFQSDASNLVSGGAHSDRDILVRDTSMGVTSRASNPGQTGNGSGSEGAAISPDGRYVAFYSQSSSLVPGDTNGMIDVFVYDRQLGQTSRASVSSSGEQGNGQSGYYGLAISSEGRYVAFASEASNLVPGDTNGVRDVFVRDKQTGSTTRVSVSSSGAEGNGYSDAPSISANGRYVVFMSEASNLVPGDTNGMADVFVRDTQTGITTRASVSSSSEQANAASFNPSISPDGRYIAFASDSSNLDSGDTNGTSDIFLRDSQAGATTRVSVSSTGEKGNGASWRTSVSENGRFVAFMSMASNLVSDDTNGGWDVFVHDVQTGRTIRTSVSSTGVQANGQSFDPSLSADGRYVAYWSDASNLVSGDTNGVYDVFLRGPLYEGASLDALAFSTQPGGLAGVPLLAQPVVHVMDSPGHLDAGFNGAVTVALRPDAGTLGAALSGTTTVNAVNGVATFTDLLIDRGGTGYVMTAMAEGGSTVDSDPFNIATPLVRVSPTGDDRHDGSSWSLAKRTLQAGADQSSGDVWVAEGVYAGPLRLNPGVTLLGGFTGVETQFHQRNWLLHQTVIDGGGAAVVVVLPSVAPSAPRGRIDGFTIRNGVVGIGTPAPYLGSVVAYASHDHITGNAGAGLSVAAVGMNFQIEDCVVDHNGGDGIFIDGPAPKINMNTVVYNGGSGIACHGSALVAGNIIAYNGSSITPQGGSGGSVRHNLSWRNAAGDYGSALPGDANGNVVADPVFADLFRGDYHLQPTSPCVDAGDDAAFSAGEEDMAGLPRILGAHADAGAFESDGTVWARAPYILHVKPDGLDVNDGLTWATAKRRIQTTVECANQPNDEVWVAAGTYHETVMEAYGTRLLGGFAGSETSRDARDPSVNVTTIDAEGHGVVVRVANIFEEVTLDGFHLLHGTPAGFSVDWINGNTVLTRCTIEDCDAGAVIANNATVTLNTIRENRGNGISLSSGMANVMAGNTISLNTGHGISDGISSLIYSDTIENNGGWGVYNLGLSALSGCVIRGNAGGVYAAPQSSSGQGTSVDRCVVSDNRADGIVAGFEAGATIALNTVVRNGGTGIVSDSMSPVYGNLVSANHDGVLMNDLSDVVGNTIAGNTGIGLRIVDTANSGVVANNVVVYNSEGVRVILPASFAPLDFRHNDVYGNTSVNLDIGPVIDITNGNMSVNPQFVDPGAGDYHLWAGSPCIDAGDDTVHATGTDLDGNQRKQGIHVDIGAYEVPPAPSGAVAGWGNNQYSEVAAGVPSPSRSPVTVAGLTDVKAVATGDYHSLALKADGTVWAWGQGGYGQLGNGHWDNHDTPVQVANLTGVVAVSARSLHSLALKSDGSVWAWGFNDNGQLGDASYNSRNAPVQVAGLADARAISAGRNFSLALMSNGTVRAWGFNGSGQLGNGTKTQSALPVVVSNLTNVVRISGGGNHSAAVLRDGTVWCWGDNALGQLGNGSLTASLVPVQATGISNATEVAAGSAHNVAVLSNGHLAAWGYNSNGQLGNGTRVNSSIAISVNSITGVASVSAGEIHSTAVTADGFVWTWGSNWIGQLGTGGTADVLTPRKLTGVIGALTVSAGWMHTLAVASTIVAPYQVAEAARALRIAGGLVNAGTSDLDRLDLVAPAGVNALDAVGIARKAAGLDTNP